ncbi:hypothetical protein D4R75_14650 [bacterium]|nr:MAG: hypothetical protein D4R75_14650 [bacterium]
MLPTLYLTAAPKKSCTLRVVFLLFAFKFHHSVPTFSTFEIEFSNRDTNLRFSKDLLKLRIVFR